MVALRRAARRRKAPAEGVLAAGVLSALMSTSSVFGQSPPVAAAATAAAGGPDRAPRAMTTTAVATAVERADAKADLRAGKGADLRRCLELADRNHPNLLEARAKLDQVRAQLSEAYFAPFSQWKMTGGMAIAPTVRGSAIFSPNTDVALTNNLGVAWRANLGGAVPLWTFGKLTNLWKAAEANVEINEAGVDVARDAVRLEVRRAYLGLQLARDGDRLLREAETRIQSALTRLQAQVARDEGDPIDLLKLQTYRTELENRKAEAEKFLRVTQAGLRYFTGVEDLKFRDEPLQISPHALKRLGAYVARARLHRPEVRQASAGLEARRAQVALRRSQLYPDLAFGLNVGFSTAPEVADQINPFVLDPGNYFRFGFGLVFQWNLDLLPGLSRVAFAEAQLAEMQALERKAAGGVSSEVEVAYADVVHWQKRLRAYEKAVGYASKWLFTVQQAIDIGTMEEKELIEPARAWAENRYNVLNATMNLNLALAVLAQKTGWDAIAPR